MSTDRFEEYRGYLTIGLANEQLEKEGIKIPIPTMRNWVNELHALKIHTIPRNERDERIFSELDIEIIRFIKEAKTQFNNNLTMQAIGRMIQSNEKFKDHLHYDPNDSEESEVGLILSSRYMEMLREELQELSQLKSELEGYIDILKLRPDPEEEKKIRTIEQRQLILDQTFTENKVRSRLRKAAIEKWNQNPKKKGVIIKKEDIDAKIEFIDNYISEHFEEEMRKEYDISDKGQEIN